MNEPQERLHLASIVLAAVCLLGCDQSSGDSTRLAGRRHTVSGEEETIEWEEAWGKTDWDLQLPLCESEEILDVGNDLVLFDSPTYKEFVDLRVTVCSSDSDLVLSRVEQLQQVFVQTFHERFESKGALCSLRIRAGAPAVLRREWTERYRDVMLRALNGAVSGTGDPRIRHYECEQRHIDYR